MNVIEISNPDVAMCINVSCDSKFVHTLSMNEESSEIRSPANVHS